ncbi:MAG TPA: type II toxin-antitoxin system RelE/ParE family toxin [Herpetosiphonaceae bacterium]
MPNDAPTPVQVYFTPEFKRNVRQLAKKYRHIKTDIQPLIDQLAQRETPGDRIAGVSYRVFKVRVKNSDLGKGKSGGYRVIYYLVREDSVVLVTLYSKPEQGDIAADEIRRIITNLDMNEEQVQ